MRQGLEILCTSLFSRKPLDRESPVSLAKTVECRSCLLMSGSRAMPGLFGEKAGKGAERGEDLGRVDIADLAAILVVGAVPHIMIAGFDSPVPTRYAQKQFCVLCGVQQCSDAGHGRNSFLALGQCRQIREVTPNESELCCATKPQLFRVYRQSP